MTLGGDQYYLSPENNAVHLKNVADKKELGEGYVLGKKSDVWALGVFLIELIHRERTACSLDAAKKSPFCQDDEGQTNAACKTYPKLEPLIRAVLTQDKETRPICSAILQISPVKEKVAEIVQSKCFTGEFKTLSRRKLELGWARPCEVKRVLLKMKEAGKTEPEDMIESHLKGY